jgi:benzylsuccinate CoA-transferase BbsF subunit
VFDKTPAKLDTSAASIGQHTKEILTEVLGYSEDEFERLAQDGVLT